MGTGRFDDLRLAVFTGRERVAVFRLDFVLVTGPSLRFARHHPPHHLGPTQVNDPAGLGPKSAPQRLPVLIAMLGLKRNASLFRAR